MLRHSLITRTPSRSVATRFSKYFDGQDDPYQDQEVATLSKVESQDRCAQKPYRRVG